MKIQETKIIDVRVLCPKVFGDNQGFLYGNLE